VFDNTCACRRFAGAIFAGAIFARAIFTTKQFSVAFNTICQSFGGRTHIYKK
jgi:hypothetical protein